MWHERNLGVLLAPNVWHDLKSKSARPKSGYITLTKNVRELVNWQNETIGANEMNIVVRLRRCCTICSPFAYACIMYF